MKKSAALLVFAVLWSPDPNTDIDHRSPKPLRPTVLPCSTVGVVLTYRDAPSPSKRGTTMLAEAETPSEAIEPIADHICALSCSEVA
jgi:hypothetical protein